MWNSFLSIFENKVIKPVKEDYWLNAKSKRSPTPNKCKIKLWPHQEAMLAKCKEIESNPHLAEPIVRSADRYMEKKHIPDLSSVAIGVMNDPPGSGKTFAILSLIADDPKPGINIIIVPQNIYTQWESAVKAIFGPIDKPSLPYLCCNNYGIISQLYMEPDAFNDFNVILMNDIYADNLAITLNDNNIKVKRFIVDEIDSVQKRMFNPIQAKHVWLLSASFVHNDYFTIGPYKILSKDMPHIICKCDPDFVAEHFGMCEPSGELIWCQDNDILLFKDLVKDEVITSLNAGDVRPLLKSMYKVYPPEKRGLKDLAEARMNELKERADELLASSDSLKLADISGTGISSDPEKIEREKARLRSESARCQEQAGILEKRLASYLAPTKTKSEVFISDICQRIKTTPASKWLIFNDNHSALFDTQVKLKSLDISCTLIDGGNPVAISNAIKSYKEGWTHEITDASGIKHTVTEHAQVLLLNATTEGAGMNLENTTHMLFMHATNSRLVEQVIGRAQRFGRVGQLLIIGLFNENERELIYNLKS